MAVRPNALTIQQQKDLLRTLNEGDRMSYTTRVVEAGKDEIFQLHGKVEKVRNRDGDGVAVTVRFTDLGQKLITLPEVGVTYEIIGIGKEGTTGRTALQLLQEQGLQPAWPGTWSPAVDDSVARELLLTRLDLFFKVSEHPERQGQSAEQQSNLRVIRALLTLARNRKIPWGAPELQEILDPLLVRMWTLKLLKEGRGLTGFLKGMKDQTAEAAATAYEATVAAEK